MRYDTGGNRKKPERRKQGTSMEPEQRRAAKQQMLELMQAGVSWQEAARTAGVQTSRATAYRWRQEARTRGEAALEDGRHGHPAKVLPEVLHWLESRCQATSPVASSLVQKELQEQLGVRISISHLNAVRAAHGWSNVTSHAEKKSGKRRSEDSRRSRRASVAGSRP
ncbi:MAG: helix-turn-helix domain containing protein [Chloroflexi bacterium]|nr:MAG: helix-turn-helix domain containing protein [Chloroflexota bacterium]